MRKITLSFLMVLMTLSLSAQKLKVEKEFSFFADIYYAFDFANPDGNERPSFFYNHTRHNEFNLNLALAEAGVTVQDRYRGQIGLMVGTYPQYNLSHEQDLLKFVYEARIGMKLSKSKELWLDTGIFPSHIGFESAVSADNYTLTRSMPAENCPYYLAGAKLTFDPNEKLTLQVVASNGWQRIQRIDGASLPGFGSQVNYHPSDKLQLNWSTFVGSEYPDDERRMRYFNNFYGIFEASEKLSLVAAFDVGMERAAYQSSDYNLWYTSTLIAHYAFNEKWAAALRGELFFDENGVIIATNTANGFKTIGTSLNLDYQAWEKLWIRVEGKLLNSQDEVFLGRDQTLSSTNVAITTSAAVRF